MGTKLYLSSIKHSDGSGNYSVNLEGSALNTVTLNVGNRQQEDYLDQVY